MAWKGSSTAGDAIRTLGRNVTVATAILLAALAAGCGSSSEEPVGPDAVQNGGGGRGGGGEAPSEEVEEALVAEEDEAGGCRQLGPSYVCFFVPLDQGLDLTEEDCAAVQEDTSVVVDSGEVPELAPDALVYRAIAAGCTGGDPAADIQAASEQAAELSPEAAALLQVIQVEGAPEDPAEAQVLLESAP